jgi:hypothetical protein
MVKRRKILREVIWCMLNVRRTVSNAAVKFYLKECRPALRQNTLILLSMARRVMTTESDKVLYDGAEGLPMSDPLWRQWQQMDTSISHRLFEPLTADVHVHLTDKPVASQAEHEMVHELMDRYEVLRGNMFELVSLLNHRVFHYEQVVSNALSKAAHP